LPADIDHFQPALTVDLLCLADLGIDQAAFVKRDLDLSENGGLIAPIGADRGFVVVGVLSIKAELRQEPALDQIDVVSRGFLIEGCRENRGIDLLRKGESAIEGFWDQRRQLWETEGARRMSDDAKEIRNRGGQICFRSS
jgi:hypothetical protein